MLFRLLWEFLAECAKARQRDMNTSIHSVLSYGYRPYVSQVWSVKKLRSPFFVFFGVRV